MSNSTTKSSIGLLSDEIIPNNVLKQHYREWQHSAVNHHIIALNVVSCSDNEAFDYLVYSDNIPRRNDGRIRDHILKRYGHIEHGGWWCSGIDLLTGELALWGCFKPDKPRRNQDKRDKRIKYEHPPKEPTSVFALQIPLALGQHIASKYECEPNFLNANGCNWFWQWVIDNPQVPIVITEGAKKAGALLSAGYVAIAVPGVNSGYRVSYEHGQKKRELIPELDVLATPGRTFYLAFDQDEKPKTITMVNIAQERLGRLLAENNTEVKIINWNPKDGKGCDDLIVNYGQQAFDQAIDNALLLDIWKARQFRQLTHLPNTHLNRRFLGELIIPESCKLIGIKSPKGTGKTESLVPLVAEAIRNGQPILVITHRIQLTKALCQRFGINYITDVRKSVEGALFGYGLCIDSLHIKSQAKFKAEDWEGCLVILDEAEQVLWHMLNSSTCQKHRVPILKSFKTLIQGAAQVIAADADLSNVTIDYLKTLTGTEPFIIRNDYKFDGWTVYRYPKPETLVKNLEKEILQGGKPFVCLSAQKDKSMWSTQNLENHLRELFPNKKILRIDSESVADPNHEAFGSITKLNEILSNYDIVITSPSIETGVSIDVKKHFTSVWGIAQGVQSESSVRQSLARLREPVDRHLYVAPHGLGKVGNGSISYRLLITSQNAMLRANLQFLRQADLPELKSVSDIDELDNFQPEALRCWSKMATRHNAGLIEYDEQIFAEIEAEGHKIISVEPSDDSDQVIRESLKDCRDRSYLASREAISNVQSFINESQYLACKDKQAKTKEERHQERNWEMLKRWGDVTPELLELDDKGHFSRFRLLYDLTLGRSYVVKKSKESAQSQIEQGGLFPPDFNRSQKGLKIKAFEILGIKELVQSNRELKNSDADLIELHRKIQTPIIRRQLNAIGLGHFKVTDTPIQILKKLLSNLGLSLDRIGRETRRGVRHWIYRLRDWGERQSLFAYWYQKDEEKQQLAVDHKNVSTSGKDQKDTSHLDTITEDKPRAVVTEVISKLERLVKAAPELLKGLVKSYVHSSWWNEIRDEVWVNAPVEIRQVINRFDFV
ncbi:hypothetical protein BJP34_35770 (plasmid) [Moorena producens PAL-8-15-08-1]|uniref:DUF3854 domain-containing protein n=1 Tax=Moorena producens PAL-8-15-08-1 TaxID=1458985 RepID=A0A1D8U4B6_9CYAN|nr:plasmid replication protein, CyRepA1 family [Moorena producens]AOX04740.1 hypothetical protein BJP34_35770 [Moorena producens PAL-8-15-08-1]